jgi:hypothetical protein
VSTKKKKKHRVKEEEEEEEVCGFLWLIQSIVAHHR